MNASDLAKSEKTVQRVNIEKETVSIENQSLPQPKKETTKKSAPEKVSSGEDSYQLKKYEVEYLLALLGKKKAP